MVLPPNEVFALVEGLRNGSPSTRAGAFIKLNIHYEPPLKGFIYNLVHDRHLTDDVSQTVFLNVFRKIDDLRENSKFEPWLFKIARNAALEERKKRSNNNGESVASDMLDDHLTVNHNKKAAEIVIDLKSEIEALEPSLKFIILLRYREGFTIPEIAEFLDEPVGTVKSKLYRIIQKLKNKMLEEDQHS